MPANIESYDHPNNLVRREAFLANQSGASATNFAPFRVRQKAVVKAIHINVKSASCANEQFAVLRNGSTIATLTPGTGGSAGSLPTTLPTRHTITLTTLNTLATLGDLMTLQHVNTDGVYDVIYEYQILPGAEQT